MSVDKLFHPANLPPAPMQRLVPELVTNAETRGVIDGVYDYVDTPIGTLFIGATPDGVARVGFEGESDPVAAFGADVGARVLPAADAKPTAGGAVEKVRQASREIEEYFAGRRREFSVAVDVRLGGFRGQVVRALPTVGYGQRVSYKDLAHQVDIPGAVRAVGSACAHNPIPIILPCHRIVRSDGTWGRYRGGEQAKTYLLTMERG